MALFPTQIEARAFANARAVVTWAGLGVPAWEAFEAQLGSFNNLIRNVAILPDSIIRQAVGATRLTPPVTTAVQNPVERALTPIEAAQVGLVWRVCRRIIAPDWDNHVDFDPLTIATTAPVAQVPGAQARPAPPPTGRKVQMRQSLTRRTKQRSS